MKGGKKMNNNITNKDIAASLTKITGSNYEECIRDASKVITKLGNIDMKGFSTLAQSKGASKDSVIHELSSLTGKNYESTLIELNKPSLGRLDSGLNMPGLPSWHPFNK